MDNRGTRFRCPASDGVGVSRCRTTNKIIYTSRTKAERALHKAIGGATADQHAYRCEDSPSHWHLGGTHTPPLTGPPPPAAGQWRHRPVRATRAEWDQITLQLWARCRDHCEWCGLPLAGNLERHHRQVRAIGGDRLANLVALHTGCHVPGVHAHPEDARERGAIVSRYADDPAAVPLLLPDGRLVLLTDSGGYLDAT